MSIKRRKKTTQVYSSAAAAAAIAAKESLNLTKRVCISLGGYHIFFMVVNSLDKGHS